MKNFRYFVLCVFAAVLYLENGFATPQKPAAAPAKPTAAAAGKPAGAAAAKVADSKAEEQCKTAIFDGDMGIQIDVTLDAKGNASLKFKSQQIQEFANRIKGKWKVVKCPENAQEYKCIQQTQTKQVLITSCLK